MLKKLLMLACAAFVLTACNDNGNDSKYATTNDKVSNGMIQGNIQFLGTSKVTTIATGEVFNDDNATFEFTGANMSDDGKSILYMHATRFAAAMPAVEMRVGGLAFTGIGKNTEADAASVIPETYVAATSTWTSMPRYIMTDLSAEIDNIYCEVEFTCMGTYHVEFKGRLLK